MCSIDEEEKEFSLKSPTPQKSSNEVTPSWSDYEIVEVLGEGAYGKVFKVTKKTSI
jgi:hypothetical protein